MTDAIDDLVRLQEQVRTLISLHKRRAKISGKSMMDLTPKQAGKVSADLSWIGMDIEKSLRAAHAAAVDCGVADPRGADSYMPVDFRPSSFHHYRYQPPKPRVIVEREASGSFSANPGRLS